MVTPIAALLLACSSIAAPLERSFPLDQPEVPLADDFPGVDAPLFGQTPLLRFANFGPADRDGVLKAIRYERDKYRHVGLLVQTEDRVYEVSGSDRGAAEARLKELGLWEPGLTVVFSRGTLADELARVLGAADPAAMRERFAFPPPKPATDPFHRPAVKDYRLTDEDRRVFELGLADAQRMSPELYPDLIPKVDAVLYDTDTLEIYSYNRDLPFPRVRRWRGYQIYRIARHARPEEHEMAICTGSVEFLKHTDVRAALGELFIACAGWGSFHRIQKARRSIYEYAEGYRSSIVHEYGHQYQALLAGSPTSEMVEIQRRIDAMKLTGKAGAQSAAHEGFADWCQLKAAKKLYPVQYRRMIERAKRRGVDDVYGHDAGMAAAAAMVEKE
ncbi:MAG: hypothetical protein ACHQ49_00375 [Elusimicrobiota bacterium]